MPSLVFQSFGWPELLIILAVLIVVFGVSRVADVGGALGRSIREFRRELKEGQEEEQKEEQKEGAAKVEGKSKEEKKS
jgi:sec-independent protein translocase protein TatA